MAQASSQIGNVHGVVATRGTATQNQIQSFVGTAASGNWKARLGVKSPEVRYVETDNLSAVITTANLQVALRALKPDGVNEIGTALTLGGAGPLGSGTITATWSGRYAGIAMPVFEIINVDLAGGTVTCTQTQAAIMGPYDNDNLDSILAMRTRLAAINGTTFSSARLDLMTANDMLYAIRMSDEPWSVK